LSTNRIGGRKNGYLRHLIRPPATFSPVEAEKESMCEFFKSPAGKTLFRRGFVVYFPP
jgi:hypothetical protein